MPYFCGCASAAVDSEYILWQWRTALHCGGRLAQCHHTVLSYTTSRWELC